MALSKPYCSDLRIMLHTEKIRIEYLAAVRQALIENMEEVVSSCLSRIEERFLSMEGNEAPAALPYQDEQPLTEFQKQMMRSFRICTSRRDKEFMTGIINIIERAVTGHKLTIDQISEIYTDLKTISEPPSFTRLQNLSRIPLSPAAVAERFPVTHCVAIEMKRMQDQIMEVMNVVNSMGLFGEEVFFSRILEYLKGKPYHSIFPSRETSEESEEAEPLPFDGEY